MLSSFGPCTTIYYNTKNEKIGISQSSLNRSTGLWDTIYYNNKKILMSTSQAVVNRQSSSCKTDFHYVPLAKLVESTSEIPTPYDERMFMKQMKKYYESKASFFKNASDSIFKDSTIEATIEKLKERALNNPDGASEHTVNHFKLNKLTIGTI
jgi:hypothetical protein